MAITIDNGLEPTQSVPGAQNVNENTTLTFSSGNSNAVTISDTVGSTDSRLQVFISVNDGVLNLSQTTGLSILGGSNGSNFMTIHGTESDINAAFEGMTFTPDNGFTGSVTLNMTTSLGAEMVGQYTFEGGNAIDQSVGISQNGTLNGDATTTNIGGTRGDVLELSGAGSVNIASDFGQPANLTLAGWVNLTASDTFGSDLWNLGDRVMLRLDSAGTPKLAGIFYNGTTWEHTEADVALSGTGWQHVAYVFDDATDTQSVYLNGRLVAQSNHADSIDYTGIGTVMIGSNPTGSNHDFTGQVDDARIYNRALSHAEIAAIAADNFTSSDSVAITVDPAANSAPTFHAAGAGGFGSGNIASSVSSSASSVAAGDFDGDGDQDIVSSSQTGDEIWWHENDGSGSFVTHSLATTADGPLSVSVADIDGDGDLDVLSASTTDNKIAWYENDGAGNFTDHTITMLANGANDVIAADVDGDGDMDVLSSSSGDDTIAWYENDGSENFTLHTITTAANAARMVTVADVNDDGHLDVLTASYADNTIAWYENDGSENFTERIVTSSATGARYVHAIDLDEDGDIDLVGASAGNDEVFWFENDGSENFSKHLISTAFGDVWELEVGDFDGDTDIDIVVGNFASPADVAWLENDGSENFTTNMLATGAGNVISLGLADIDGDNDQDLLTAAWSGGDITWYESLLLESTLDVSPTFIEGGAAVVLDADVDVSDTQLDALNGGNGNFDGASLTIVRNGGANSDDVLSFNDGNGITLSGANLIKNSQIIATFDTTTTAGELVLTFTDANGETPTSTDVDNILRQITYANSSDGPPSSVQIDWTFDDGNSGSQGSGGALDVTGSTTVNITAVSDDPITDAHYTTWIGDSEFVVNTYTTNQQDSPSITALTDGGFVVAWESNGNDGNLNGVFFQRYDAAGNVVGSETQVNTTTANAQQDVEVTSLAGGGFVVTWESNLQDGDSYGVFARVFGADGSPTSGELSVNTTTADTQSDPVVVGLQNGTFVVAWESDGQDGDGAGVYFRQYSSTGFPNRQ